MCGCIGIGLAVFGGGVERATLGFAGAGVDAVVAEAGTWMKQTSGGSMDGQCSSFLLVQESDKCTYRVLVAEYETEAVDLIFVQWVVVEDSDVHLPFSEVFCFDDVYARRELLFRLTKYQSYAFPRCSIRR